MNGNLFVDSEGNKYWLKNGKLHRDNDLPAAERIDGTKQWFQNNSLHRIGSPAIISGNGEKTFALNNVEYSEEGYWKEIGKRYGLVIKDKAKL